MKDEIKEILDNFKIYEDRYKKCNETQFIIFYRDIHLLLDYITNLQQKLEYYENIDPDKTIDKFRQKINREMFNLQEENKELKHKLEQMYNDTKDTYNEICAEQVDYKSRNEKAIEYIKSTTCYGMRSGKTLLHKYLNDLLNTLQGSDKDEKEN